MTLANPVLPGAALLSTRRTIDGRFFLRPDPVVNHRVRFALAYSASKHDIELYCHATLSNHLHTGFGDPLGRHPLFRGDFHQLITRSINQQRGVKGARWSPDPTPPCTLFDREALLNGIAYILAQACRHHLVERLEDWPGFITTIDQLAGPPVIVKRPPGLYDPKGEIPEEVELRFVKPPMLADLTDEEYREEIARRVEVYCEEARGERKRLGITVVGRQQVLETDPEDRPTQGKPLGARKPTIACRTIDLRVAVLKWLKAFRKTHRSARVAFDAGDRTVPFPKGTFFHRVRYGVPCEATGPPDFQWAAA